MESPLALFNNRPKGIGGGQKAEYFSIADIGVAQGSTTPVKATHGIFAVSSYTERVTDKKGRIRAFTLTCIIPPTLPDGSPTPTLRAGMTRNLFAAAADNIRWDELGKVLVQASGVPLAPEHRLDGIEYIKGLVGKYPPGYTPGSLNIADPEHDNAIGDAFFNALELLVPFAADGEGAALAACNYDDDTGLLRVDLVYAGAMRKDEHDKRVPKLGPDGKQAFYMNPYFDRLGESDSIALAEAIAGDKLPKAALDALGPKFVAAAKAWLASQNETAGGAA